MELDDRLDELDLDELLRLDELDRDDELLRLELDRDELDDLELDD